jgi:hypothetical protein
MKHMARLLTVFIALLVFTGCSTFEQDWRHAVLQPPVQPGNPTGPWQGTWLSKQNGHTGELRCLVTEKAPNEYEYRFKATYWKLFRYSYTVNLPTTCTTDGCNFKGTENLGYLAGGDYDYEGVITTTNFNATYKCKFDHGTFQMTRTYR